MSIARPILSTLCVGEWIIHPATGEMSRGEVLVRLEERPLRLLLCLAEHAGEVLSIDDLLTHVWQGVVVSPDSIYQAITSLRRQLGDEAKNPTYIETVPRRGYRLIAMVKTVPDKPEPGLEQKSHDDAQSKPVVLPAARPTLSHRPWLISSTAALIVLVACFILFLLFSQHAITDSGSAPAKPLEVARSVAVLPFNDLTDQMSEEPFADGMTEEMIGKLSKVPGLAVSPPASSFYFKDQHVTVAEVAKALHVAFVLDGSVRKSGATLRVAARLTRVSDGFVIWSENYDRSWTDKLMIQDDIAGEVSKALAKSIQ